MLYVDLSSAGAKLVESWVLTRKQDKSDISSLKNCQEVAHITSAHISLAMASYMDLPNFKKSDECNSMDPKEKN